MLRSGSWVKIKTQNLDNELNHIKSTFIVYSDDPYNFPARKEVSCRNPQVKW